MSTLPTLRPITRAVLLPCMVASQLIRLNSRMGWLTLPDNPTQDGYEFRTSLEIRIVPYYEGVFDTAERPTDEDVRAFYREKSGVAEWLTDYYAKSGYTGD